MARNLRNAPALLVAAAAALAAGVTLGAGPASPAYASSASSTTVVEHRVIGQSVLGRPIDAYRKGNPDAARKVVVFGQMHGNETFGVAMADHLVQRVAVSLQADVWVLPTINPDGLAAGTRTNAHGVDLNRNFPEHWVRAGKGTSEYSGRKPANQPETKAVIAFLDAVHARYLVSMHSPLYGVGYDAKNLPFVHRLSRHLGFPVKHFDCFGGCHGTMTDWYNHHHRGTAITAEYGTVATRGVARGILRSTYAY